MGGGAVAPDGSLFISETDRGRIGRIVYTGEQSAPMAKATAATPSPSPKVSKHPGRTIYDRYCATCHMPDGSGAASLQPALAGSAVVAGDKGRLIDLVLRGPAAVLPADRP